MPTDVDRQLQRSAELLNRVSARQLQKRARAAGRRAKRMAQYAFFSVTAIILVAIGAGFVAPLGFSGVMLTALAIMVALVLSVMLSGERKVPARDLGRLEITALPAATERWLDGQRAALPAPATQLFDRIGDRLEALAPQLVQLGPEEPAAREVRALLSEHLPQLVSDYRSIPKDLRRVERNGRVPDRQLVDGLSLIEKEIGEMTENLARGDLDRLAAHGRYLEIKYQEMKEIGQG